MDETLAMMALAGESPNVPALDQPVWFIDPVNGNNNNDGSTAGTALKTLTELSRRWGKGNTLSPQNGSVLSPPTVTVNILNSTDPTDIPNFDVILGPSAFGGTQLLFKGTVLSATPLTGPFTVTTKNRATNTPAGTPWALLTGAPAAGLVTGGANPTNIRLFDATGGGYFWAFKVAVSSPNAVNFSEPFTVPAIGSRLTNGNRFTPANGDNFELQTFTQINLGEMRIGGVRQGNSRPRVVFQDLGLGTTTLPTTVTSIVSDGVTEWYWYGCSIARSMDSFDTSREMFFENCAITLNNTGGPAMSLSGLVFFDGGAHTFQTFPADAAFYRLDMDVILEKCIIQTTAILTLEFGTCGIFDAVGIPGGIPATVSVAAPSVEVIKLQDTVGFLWGGGPTGQNPGFGVYVTGGKVFRYATFSGVTPANITITGALGDFALAAVAPLFNIAPPAFAPPSVTPLTAGSFVANANAGVGANTTGSAGNGQSGVIVLTTGAAPVAGDQVDVTFTTPYPTAPNVVIMPSEANAAGATVTAEPFITTTATGFKINVVNALAAGTTYKWSYSVTDGVGPFASTWVNLGSATAFNGTAVNPVANAWILPI
jgi:hypothetical protein